MMSESLQLPPLILTEHPRHAVEREGRAAFAANEDRNSNPYPPYVSQWVWWRAGWNDAAIDQADAAELEEVHA